MTTGSPGAAQRSPWRWPAAALALVVAGAHIPITAEHLSEAPYLGWSFVALEVTAAVVAVALVLRDSRVVWSVAGALPALAIAAYVLTRSVPLPQIADDVGSWADPLGIVAVTAEALMLGVALVHAHRSWRPAVLSHPVGLAATVLAVGLAAVGYAAVRGSTGMADPQAMARAESTLPPLQWSSFADQWHLRPWWLLFSVLVLTGYVAALVMARRHHRTSVHPARAACFVAGVLLLLFTVSSAIDVYAMAIFWDHMVEHLLLIMVVPALLVMGHPIAVLRSAAATQGGEGTVEGFARSGIVSALTHPVVGFGLYATVIVATHLSGFMDAMATHGWLAGAEQWLYFVTGYVFLLPLLAAEPIRRQLPYLGRLGILLLGMTPDTVVGIVLLQTTHDMFPVMHASQPSWAPDPVQDVNIGGALMWAGGDGLMMLFGVGVALAMITHTRSELLIGGRLEGIRRRTLTDHATLAGVTVVPGEGTDLDEDDAVLDAYNQMLARMSGKPTPPNPDTTGRQGP